MAQFQGFTCDGCGDVLTSSDRTKVKTKLDGPEVQGQYDLDLCTECAMTQLPEDVELKPLRRRRPKGAATEDDGGGGTPPEGSVA